MSDIIERRLTTTPHYLEQELRALLRTDPKVLDWLDTGSLDGIWYWDLEQPENEWLSPAFKQLFGYAEDEMPHSPEWWQANIHPDDLPVALENFEQHKADPSHPYDQIVRYRHKDGSMIWVRCRGLMVRNGDGTPKRMLGAHTDVTALKKTEEELRRSNKELDDFANIAAHDLKEPLRASCQHASFLLEDYGDQLNDEVQRRLQRLIALNQRMERLIADLHYFSRLGRSDEMVEDLGVEAAIAELRVDFAEALHEGNAKIDVSGPLPRIEGHKPHVMTIFRNLISNGLKYNDNREKLIEIGQVDNQSWDSKHALVTLYVKDNGIGIDEEFKDEVFQMFKRLNSEKAYGGGTGAGLSFVKKIVERQGGQIWLTTEPGKGTTFFFTLRRSTKG